MAITFVTTTSHGSWLPGDLRGYVQDGIILPSNPRLLKFSKSILKSDPIFLSRHRIAINCLNRCGPRRREFNYRLTDVAIESWHLHWIIAHGDDPVEATVGRLKTRMRQALAVREFGPRVIGATNFAMTLRQKVRQYITSHAGCRMTNGKILC